MSTFESGEAVYVRGTTKDEDGILVTPAVSTKITILDPAGTEVTSAQDVTFTSVGVWEYLYTPTGTIVVGAYHARVKAIDVASPERSSISDSEFFVVD